MPVPLQTARLAVFFVLMAPLLMACAGLPVVGGNFGACVLRGEDFTHVIGAEATYWDGGRTSESLLMSSLDLQRSPEAQPIGVGGEYVHACVIPKDDWPELRDDQASRDSTWFDTVTMTTPRGQELELIGYDIDHWMLMGSSVPLWK